MWSDHDSDDLSHREEVSGQHFWNARADQLCDLLLITHGGPVLNIDFER